jgi:Do/DeqQ family serine protease
MHSGRPAIRQSSTIQISEDPDSMAFAFSAKRLSPSSTLVVFRWTLNFHLFIILTLIPFFLSAPAPAHADLRNESPVVQAVQKVSDAVVNISTEYEVQFSDNPFSRFSQDSLFDYFFKDFYEPGFRQNLKRTSLGSGVIIDGSLGFVLTNTHVIAESGTIHVILKDERQFEAKIVGADSESDLAVLKISPDENLPAINMGNSDDLLIGETVIAIGNPFGFSNTVTTGVISALNRTIQADDMTYRDFIQTDASINPGNSGGPLLNINGDLIGINTAVYANAQGIGFAIPISKARRIVNDLIKYGEVVHGWIGLFLQTLDGQVSEYLGMEEDGGVLVSRVYAGSPAEKAGIMAGDIILAMDRNSISSREDYQSIIKDASVEDNITVMLQRNNDKVSVQVEPSAFPLDAAIDLAQDLLGVRVSDAPETSRGRYRSRFTGGVTVTAVASNSYLSKIGVSQGDIIHAIDEIAVSNIEDFKKAVASYRLNKTVVLLIERNGRLYNVTVDLS